MPMCSPSSVRGATGITHWVGGAASSASPSIPSMSTLAYFYRVPGFFAQDDIRWTDWLTLSASARLDVHSTYGTFFSPRVSALVRHDGWTSRVSAGHGFFPSSPQTEETEAAGLSGLAVPIRSKPKPAIAFPLDVTRIVRGSRSPRRCLLRRRARRHGRTRIGLRVVQRRRPGDECRDGTARHVAPGALCPTGTYSYVRSREQDGDLRVDLR